MNLEVESVAERIFDIKIVLLNCPESLYVRVSTSSTPIIFFHYQAVKLDWFGDEGA